MYNVQNVELTFRENIKYENKFITIHNMRRGELVPRKYYAPGMHDLEGKKYSTTRN